MKRKITLLLLAAGSMFKMHSQVVLQENFTATFTPASAGWGTQNNSNPVGSLGWFQGNGANVFPAYNGNANDYFAANFNSQGAAAGGISNWLITPTVTIYDGAVIEFATRVAAATPVFPDGLQLRMSTAGTASAIPAGTASVGNFTDLLLDINPLLSTNNASAVTNGSVNGYPQAWTVYSVQISGVTGTVTGRFAFRYVVNDGGPNGANSSYVGIDAVKYTLPCAPTVQSYTTCAGVSTTLNAVGLASTSYSWDTGATTSSIVVSPATTTTYSLFPSVNGTACGNVVTAVVTVSSNLAVNISAPSTTVCEGEDITLTASGSATQYAWSNGGNIIGTTAAVTVTPPIGPTTYSVGGLNGFSCTGGNTIVITAVANPTVSITSASTLLCVSGPSTSVTFTGNGASNYIWVLGNSQGTGATIGVNIPAQTATTPATSQTTLGMIGIAANGCFSTDIFTLTVNKTPTLTVTSSTASACVNTTVTITGAGATTYSWSGAATSTANPLAFATGSVAGAQQFVLTGASVDGCTNTAQFTQNVVTCNTNTTTVGLNSISANQETAIFPNPFTNELKVNVLEGTVFVYNALGQVVITTAVHSTETINTSALPKGVYLVKAFNTNGELVKSLKVIKN